MMDIPSISVGLELEANVIDMITGHPILNFNHSEFEECANFIKSQGFYQLQTEFDAATLEIGTLPYSNIGDAFLDLDNYFKVLNSYLFQKGYLLLLMGLHLGRNSEEFIVTKSYSDLKSCMAENGESLYHCGFQINFGMSIDDIEYILPMCQWLQIYMWPLSIITQSSPIFSNKNTNYMSYRLRLNDYISGSRTGLLPTDIHDLEAFQHYYKHLPNQNSLSRNCTWFDILPKPILENHQICGYRIEVRVADTSELSKLLIFSQAMILTFLSLYKQLKSDQSLPNLDNRWYILNRDSVLKNGKNAILTPDGQAFYSVEDFLRVIWRPLIAEYSLYLGMNIEDLITELLKNSRSEEMILLFENMSGLEIARHYAFQDFKKS